MTERREPSFGTLVARRLTMAKRLGRLWIACSFGPILFGYLWMRLEGIAFSASASSILWQACLLVFGVLAGILPAFFKNRLFPRCAGVLWLRRFHREQWPEFPMSQVFRRLGELGFPVVTLRDRAVRGSEGHRAAWYNWMMLLAFPLMLGAVFGTMALVWPHLENDGSSLWRMFGGWLFLAPLIAAFLPVALMRLGSRVIRFMPATIVLRGKKAHGWFLRLGKRAALNDLAVVRTSDLDWVATVSGLMRAADCIVVDLTSPSPNLRLEVELIQRAGQASKTIWTVADEAPARKESPIKIGSAASYEVLGVTFPGRPSIYKYPRDADGSEYWRRAGHRERSSRCDAIALQFVGMFDTLLGKGPIEYFL